MPRAAISIGDHIKMIRSTGDLRERRIYRVTHVDHFANVIWVGHHRLSMANENTLWSFVPRGYVFDGIRSAPAQNDSFVSIDDVTDWLRSYEPEYPEVGDPEFEQKVQLFHAMRFAEGLATEIEKRTF